MPAGDKFRKVSRGDKFSFQAQAYNAMVDAAKAHAHKQNLTVDKNNPFEDSGIVLVKNTSGAAVGVYHVLGIEYELIISPSGATGELQRSMLIDGVTPTAAHLGKFVVAMEAIPDDEIGRAWISGTFPCQVDVTSDASGTDNSRADIKAGSTNELEINTSGSAEVLTLNPGTGSQWASVRVGGGSSIPSPSATGQMLYSPSGTTWEILTPTADGQVIQVVNGVPVFQLHELT